MTPESLKSQSRDIQRQQRELEERENSRRKISERRRISEEEEKSRGAARKSVAGIFNRHAAKTAPKLPPREIIDDEPTDRPLRKRKPVRFRRK